MDGAGRLARSLRSLGPQADLKAAAIGAVVLTREWLGLPARKKKAAVDRSPPNRVILWLERYLPGRIVVALTVLLLLGSLGLGVVKGGHVDAMMETLSDTRNALANWAGFRITTVAINGRKQLSQDEVLAIGGVNGRSSLLFLDAATVRDKLKANPWIADATILKFYPGALQIDIVERSAFALWQQDGRLSNLKLAEAVALSPTAVLARVQRLTREGYILGYEARLNPLKLGAGMLVFVEVLLDRTTPNVFEAFKAAVQVYDEIMECHMVAGGFDYLLKTRMADMAAYRQFAGTVLWQLPGVRETRTYAVMEEVKHTARLALRG